MSDDEPRWTRKTPWRQGSLLCPNALARIGVTVHSAVDSPCAIVISHDCDLAQDDLSIEPYVEVIVGRFVQKSDGNLSWGKNPRALHLPVEYNDSSAAIELIATDRKSVAKNLLAPFAPDGAFRVEPKSLSILRSWLAARYNRAAFPDEFVNRMQTMRLDEKLAKILKGHSDLFSFVFFRLDDGQMLERAEGDPYELVISLVYAPGDDPEQTQRAAERVAKEVIAVFDARLAQHGSINLKDCIEVSEDDIKVSQARLLHQWRLEHMSFRQENEQLGPPKI